MNMTGYEPEKTLNCIEEAIEREALPHPEPLPVDQWLASSAMQKSIRRGEGDRAIRAAHTLWTEDRQNFWRRLHVAALEDIGIGDPDAVVKVLVATAAPAWRRRIGDLRVG